jgi:hypothetical protein
MPTGGTAGGGTAATGPQYAAPTMENLTQGMRNKLLGLSSFFGTFTDPKFMGTLPANLGKATQITGGSTAGSGVTGAGQLATGDYSARYITGLNLIKLLKDTGFTGDALRTAFGVVMGESGGDRFGRNFNKAAASGGSRDNLDLGLFQINDLYNRSFKNEVGQTEQVDFGSKIFDAPYNSRLGFIYAKSRGWGDWNSWRDKTQAYQEGLGIFDKLPKYADGGHIQGPGGPKDDKIPAMISNGEYVVNANSVRKYGRGFMDSVNKGRLVRHFEAGGAADRGYEPTPSRTTNNEDSRRDNRPTGGNSGNNSSSSNNGYHDESSRARPSEYNDAYSKSRGSAKYARSRSGYGSQNRAIDIPRHDWTKAAEDREKAAQAAQKELARQRARLKMNIMDRGIINGLNPISKSADRVDNLSSYFPLLRGLSGAALLKAASAIPGIAQLGFSPLKLVRMLGLDKSYGMDYNLKGKKASDSKDSYNYDQERLTYKENKNWYFSNN